jgi:tRNA U34 5-carboxymethylaminomethyl modifying enzyme MnmG/GidA
VKYEGTSRRSLPRSRASGAKGRAEFHRPFSFDGVPGLSREVAQRLTERRPETIGGAARIPG